MTSLSVGCPAEPTRHDLLDQLAALQGKLATLAAIEQVKGAIMVSYGLTADAAFELLKFHSQTRNLKLRAIADRLASLLSSGPASSHTITAFDRLIDSVTRDLQTPDRPAAELTGSAVTMASLWAHIAADRDPSTAPPPVPTAPPGITIAGNVANLPLVYANEAFGELTGYPIGDVLGRNCRFLQGAATDPRHITTLTRALRTGREVSVVMRNYRSDGSPFLNRVSISPIRNPIHQITHFIGTQIEVTDRHSAATPAPNQAGRVPASTPPTRATVPTGTTS